MEVAEVLDSGGVADESVAQTRAGTRM